MASYGHTFTSGDTVTPTKLNAARTVSDIVNADIKSDAAITHSKLANIPSGQLLLGNGSNVPTATAVTGDVTISSAGVTAITAGAIVTADLADGAVTSAKIADGTIVNADVAANAAIAGTKIVPDFGSQLVTMGNTVNVGGADSTNTIVNIGAGATGNKFAVADFIGDTTYTDFGLRVGRKNDGANGTSTIEHRGTGGLQLNAIDAGFVNIATSNTERMRIDATGNVGIGTLTPSAKLDVNGSLNVTGVAALGTTKFSRQDTNVEGGEIQLARSSDNAVAWLIDAYGSGNSPSLRIFDGPTQTVRAFITGDGNVGIGTGSPSTKLEVAGTVTATAFSGPLTGTASAIADGTVSTAKIVDSAVTTAKLAAATQQSLVPAGAVMPFAMNSAPSGWLAADGSAVSRSTYSALFAAIGVTHGAGDSVTTFNLPDLRGIFVRGSGSQTISGTTYSGTFAAKQQDDLKSHTHGYTDAGVSQTGLTGGPTPFASTATTARTTDSTGGTETRPANVALLYCIKF